MYLFNFTALPLGYLTQHFFTLFALNICCWKKDHWKNSVWHEPKVRSGWSWTGFDDRVDSSGLEGTAARTWSGQWTKTVDSAGIVRAVRVRKRPENRLQKGVNSVCNSVSEVSRSQHFLSCQIKDTLQGPSQPKLTSISKVRIKSPIQWILHYSCWPITTVAQVWPSFDFKRMSRGFL